MKPTAKLHAIAPVIWELGEEHWPELEEEPMVFIARHDMPAEGPGRLGGLRGSRLYLFGGPVEEGPGAYHLDFTVVEQCRSGNVIQHCLSQGTDGSFWSSMMELSVLRVDRERYEKAVTPTPERIAFGSAMGSAAMDLVGVFYWEHGYEEELWARYLGAGKPKKVGPWLRAHMRSDFQWVSQKPLWVEGEAEWPTVGSLPMVFVAQTALPKNDVTRRGTGRDEMLYVFGGFVEGRSEIKIAMQTMGTHTVERQ